jgi:hypothetical protein
MISRDVGTTKNTGIPATKIKIKMTAGSCDPIIWRIGTGKNNLQKD